MEPAAIEVATTVMTPELPVQPMGDIDAPIQRGLSLSYGSCTIPGYRFQLKSLLQGCDCAMFGIVLQMNTAKS